MLTSNTANHIRELEKEEAEKDAKVAKLKEEGDRKKMNMKEVSF